MSALVWPMLSWLQRGQSKSGEWRSALASDASLEQAIQDLDQQVSLRGFGQADLAVVFVSTSFASELSRILPLLQRRFQATHWLGCCGGGVIGVDRHGRSCELEQQPAVGLSLIRLPGAVLQSFHVDLRNLPDLDGPREPWRQLAGMPHGEAINGLLLLVDPGSSGIKDLLGGLDYAFPGVPKVGGIAAPHGGAGGSLLFQDKPCTGAIGLAIGGDWIVQAVVAQGCRPVGPVFEVQEARRNVVLKLQAHGLKTTTGGQAPVGCLQEVIARLNAADRELVRHSLFVGLASNSFSLAAEESGDDFLIRAIVGVDPRNGAIAVADSIRVGQRLQFHLRDGRTSRAELQHLLSQQRQTRLPPLGAFCFACVGRGRSLYGEPDVDSGLCRTIYPHLPIGGLFCSGEIGPIHGVTHLHGFTASWSFLCPKETDRPTAAPSTPAKG
ncbi:MAG: FIST C-terminal domain-containing protein [Cyanobacteria bacterium MAG CAR3_bin_5]|nr:FIST C-terminal domain-containing protein [Cyanobacteria bacterium MAG CAR3_bin_5]